VIGLVGPVLGYVLLSSARVIITDPLLLACLALPTAALLVAALVPRLRRRALTAAIACAVVSAGLVLVVGGGIALIAGVLSDPRP
jgi:hypothetical protein